jgi:hypothetical protein
VKPVRCSMPGHKLELAAYDGKLFRFVSPNPYAPGQPLRIEAALSSSITLELTSIGSVKLPDGQYEVRARASTLHREARAALVAHFGSPLPA